MDTIAIRTSNSIPVFEFTPSHEVSPSATVPPTNGIANGMVQQATQAPAKPSVASKGFFTRLLQLIHAG